MRLPQVPGQPVPRPAQTRITQCRRHALHLRQRLARLGQHERRLLCAGALQQIDHAAHFLRRQGLAPRQRQHRFLVARRQPRQLPRQRRTHQSQTQILFHRHAQLLQQRQPPAHPTLVPAQQVRRFHLRHAIVTHQALHDPRFLQFPHRPLVAVQAQDRRLGRAARPPPRHARSNSSTRQPAAPPPHA